MNKMKVNILSSDAKQKSPRIPVNQALIKAFSRTAGQTYAAGL